MGLSRKSRQSIVLMRESGDLLLLFLVVGIDPVDNALVMDTKQSANAPEVDSFQIHFDSL